MLNNHIYVLISCAMVYSWQYSQFLQIRLHFLFVWFVGIFLPARASEQGNVIGSVCIYIYIYIYVCVCTKKVVIERTRDLIYLKFVATDFFLKIISPSAGENSGYLA